MKSPKKAASKKANPKSSKASGAKPVSKTTGGAKANIAKSRIDDEDEDDFDLGVEEFDEEFDDFDEFGEEED